MLRQIAGGIALIASLVLFVVAAAALWKFIHPCPEDPVLGTLVHRELIKGPMTAEDCIGSKDMDCWRKLEYKYANATWLTGGELESLEQTPERRWEGSKGGIYWQNDGPVACPALLKKFMETGDPGDPGDLPTAEALAETMSRASDGHERVLNADYIIHCLVRPRDPALRAVGPDGYYTTRWKLVK